MTYTPNPQQTAGGITRVVTSDDDIQQLLNSILKELKKMNVHLEIVTDNRITNQEIS